MTKKDTRFFRLGERIGRWVVMVPDPNRDSRVVVVCDCGTRRLVHRSSLLSGRSTSCGCYQKEKVSTHGMSNTRTYRIWDGMLQRCTNPKSWNYKRYGAKGISVCEEWKSFDTFLADMGEAPDGLELDRKENSEGYSKSNCRWTTHTENNRNKRVNDLISYKEETRCLTEWAEIAGMLPFTLYCRIYRLGWSVEDSMTRPVKGGRPRKYQQGDAA